MNEKNKEEEKQKTSDRISHFFLTLVPISFFFYGILDISNPPMKSV